MSSTAQVRQSNPRTPSGPVGRLLRDRSVFWKASTGGDRPLLELVMPKWSGHGLQTVFGHRMPPMPVMVVAALARRHGWDVRLLDENYQRLENPRRRKPDAAGLTVWTMFAPHAYELADGYRERGIPVILGGVHASMMPGEALRHADAVVGGEAESVLPEVLDDLLAGRSKGLYHGPWLGMDTVPQIDEWFEFNRSWPLTRYIPANTLQATRGCRFNCDFCSVIRINGRGSRHRDVEEVVEQLRRLHRRGQRFAGWSYTFLLDDDLAADLEFTEELCEAIIRAKLKGLTWGAQASIGLTRDKRLLDIVARSGCGVVFTGFESISREGLIECNKKNRPSQFHEAVERLHSHKIMVQGGFIFGFDHDEPDVFDATVEFVDGIGVDAAHFSILTPYPGTQTFARMAREQRIVHYDWSLYDLYHVVFKPMRMTADELLAGLQRTYRNFYSRDRRWRRLRGNLAGRYHPAFTMALAACNEGYARRYGKPDNRQPQYQPPPEEIDRLLKTSTAPAQEAIKVAIRQARPLVPAGWDGSAPVSPGRD